MTIKSKDIRKPILDPEKILYDDQTVLKEEIYTQMIHDENPELANELIEWEDDGEGHFIPHWERSQ